MSDKTRCEVCNKKLGLMKFECKCGKMTCSSHRGVGHDCSYDYYSENKEILKHELEYKPSKQIVL